MDDIAVDLLEIPIPRGNHLLVVVHNYSWWPEVILLKKTDAAHFTKAMDVMFQTHGLPLIVRSDLEPPFSSARFEGFLEYLRITHNKGTPYWPQSIGEVERCKKTLLKKIRVANLEGRDWKKAVQDFLLHFRTTPCTVTGSSLAELLMGRRLNEKVPRVTIPTDRISTAHCQQLLRKRDPRAKLRQKSMWMRSARKNTVTLWKVMRSCLTRAAKTNYRQVIQEKGNAVIIEDQEGNTKMRNTYEKSLSSQTLTLIPRRNRRVGHCPQMQQKKLNRRLQQSLPKILPFLLEQRKLLHIGLFVLDSLPPG